MTAETGSKHLWIIASTRLCIIMLLASIGCAKSPEDSVLVTASQRLLATPILSLAAQPATQAVVSSNTSVMQEPMSPMSVAHAFPNLSFSRMVHLTYPIDGTNRLFLALQPGQVILFENNAVVDKSEIFLDIRHKVNNEGSEEGLLGLAFDPQYTLNGYIYVYYTASYPRKSIISRFSVSGSNPNRIDPNSELTIMEVPQPYSNHNGGQMMFGPEGHLYISFGDGGKAGDPYGHGQDRSTLLGSILRINVQGTEGDQTYTIPADNPFFGQGESIREEIWAYGLRNPWRFTFDRQTGEMWAGDVGQDRYEEIDIIKAGHNYGWSIMEGTHCFKSSSCDKHGLESPVVEYSHSNGCSVIGGYVYRGTRLPSLYGAYIYGDFCSGKIWALRHEKGRVKEQLEILDSSLNISAFGEDQNGEIYILAFDRKIYQLVDQ